MNLADPVSSLMSKDILTATPDIGLEELRDTLLASGVHHLPIVDGDGGCVGILSHTDLRSAAPGTTAAELMMMQPVTVFPDDPLALAVAILANGIFHALPVVDDAGSLCGVLTTSDVLRALLSEMSAED